VRWHKASRGAPSAVARNRVPEAHTLPANPPNTPWPARFHHSAPKILPPPDSTDKRATDIFLHHVVYGEDNQFQMPRVQYWIALRSGLSGLSTLRLPNWNVPPFTLTGGNDTLQCLVGPRQGRHYAITDTGGSRPVLATGQWMQVRYNGRHIYGEDGTWYTKST
jgi:hypothetical protein